MSHNAHALRYSREPAPQPIRATAYVEYERGQYVGFAIDGGKVERVIETPDRELARLEAEARAARLNNRRNRSPS